MYVINHYAFGLDINKHLADNPDFPLWVLEELFSGFELPTGRRSIDKELISFRIDTHYDGGSGFQYPGVVGYDLSTDDGDKHEYLKVIRHSDEKFFRRMWAYNRGKVLEHLRDRIPPDLSSNEREDVEEVLRYIEEGTPSFHIYCSTS